MRYDFTMIISLKILEKIIKIIVIILILHNYNLA